MIFFKPWNLRNYIIIVFLKGPSCQRNENYEILFTVKKIRNLMNYSDTIQQIYGNIILT